MLKPIARTPRQAAHGRFAIVASRYNARYVDAMIRGARRCLSDAGVRALELQRVPGAFEIPLAAAVLARRRWPRLDGILALGVILRGETTHAEHIGVAVSQALLQIQLETEIPVIHEVLLLENLDQAKARCLDGRYNRGHEAAQTALEMAGVIGKLRGRMGGK